MHAFFSCNLSERNLAATNPVFVLKEHAILFYFHIIGTNENN